MIKEFKVPQIDKYDFSDVDDGAPVFFQHQYIPDAVCGKVAHISDRRKIVNIEFMKFHPLYKVLKGTDFMLKLDLVYDEQLDFDKPRRVRAFVVYHEYDPHNS